MTNSTEIKNTKRYQTEFTELKNTITKLQNTIEGFKNKLRGRKNQ